MMNPVQLLIRTERTVGRALQVRADKEGVSTDVLINEILRKALASEIDEVEGTIPLADVIQKVVNTKGLSPANPSADTVSYHESWNSALRRRDRSVTARRP